jgi:hypothetical protein
MGVVEEIDHAEEVHAVDLFNLGELNFVGMSRNVHADVGTTNAKRGARAAGARRDPASSRGINWAAHR